MDLDEEEDEEDSESEDSEGVLITPAVEKSFMELLPMIHAKKTELYASKDKVFPEYEDLVEESKKLHSGEKRSKPMKIKDYVRKTILEKMEEESDDEEEGNKEPTPHEELMNIKKKLKDKIAESSSEEDEDDFLVLRSKSKADLEKEEEEYEKWEFTKKQKEKLNPKKLKSLNSADLLAHFWSAADTDDSNENFLRRFIRYFLDIFSKV